MILVAVGSNLPSFAGSPLETCRAAVAVLAHHGVSVTATSRCYRSPADPPTDQPDFINGAVAIETSLKPAELLKLLHQIEREFGRVRGEPNAARTLDLDLIDYHGRIEVGPPVLPHPRVSLRAFVLKPLIDIAPSWRHPVNHSTPTELLKSLTEKAIAGVVAVT